MNTFVKLTKELVENILDEFPPNQDWMVVNLALVDRSEKKKRITFDKPFSDIPPAFCYKDPGLLGFLYKNHFINEEPLVEYGWFSGTFRPYPLDPKGERDIKERMWDQSDYDAREMTERLQEEGIIDKEHRVAIFTEVKSRDEYSITEWELGPKLPGQAFMLVFRHDLQHFLRFYEEQKPWFDDETKTLHFLGEEMKFGGQIESQTLKLLITHLNTLVPKEEFYRLRGIDDYNAEVKRIGKERTHENSDETIKSLKKKIRENNRLKNALIFVIQDGYGVFVNESELLSPNRDKNEINEVEIAPY